MANFNINTQYVFTGQGPLDAKTIVKTFEDLISENTWYLPDDAAGGSDCIAYNGMVVSVWGDPDESKNGVYFLYQAPTASSDIIDTVVETPDVTKSDNWHKLCTNAQLQSIAADLAEVKTSVETLTSVVTDTCVRIKDNALVCGKDNDLVVLDGGDAQSSSNEDQGTEA